MTTYCIALIGYGKMGKTIHRIAEAEGHRIPLVIDLDRPGTLEDLDKDIDVAIEFSRPDAAVRNISACLRAGIPVVSGTTGWLDALPQVKQICTEENGAFFYASNFSVGVNIFFALNRFLAKLMTATNGYQVQIDEIHHTEKLDAPSGTAITLAEGIIGEDSSKSGWISTEHPATDQIPIISHRLTDIPGTHIVKFQSEIDQIEIKHVAHSREGFARGALHAAKWLVGKRGVFGMEDLLNFTR